jgi:hypothetical protein
VGICWISDTLTRVAIQSTSDLEADKIVQLPIRFISETSYLLRYHYSILVQQFSLSEEAFRYWSDLKKMNEGQGSLSDIQPGAVVGNVFSLENSDEPVLGYFDVSEVAEKRIVFNAADFYDEGLLRPPTFRSSCYDMDAIWVPEMSLGEYMNQFQSTMNIYEVTGGLMGIPKSFSLYPKRCTDCTDAGANVRPEFMP